MLIGLVLGIILCVALDTKAWRQICRKPANAWGLFDMHGNVSEWVWDRLDEYTVGAKTDPTGPTDRENRTRILRGGSWTDYEEPLRSAYLDSFSPEGSSNNWASGWFAPEFGGVIRNFL